MRALTIVSVLLCTLGVALDAQEQARHPVLEFGPRLGATGVIINPDTFNATMQALFPTPGRHYFPAFSEMGVEATQLVPLGEGGSSLCFRQIFLLGALDQSIVVPTLNAILAYQMPFGLEIGVGPFFSITSSGGSIVLAASVVYEVGYTFEMKGFSLPVNLLMVPLPGYANPRLTLTTGFDFAGPD
jgi:hypothetical protein